MNFKDLKLGTKLAIGFGSLIMISVIIGGLAIINMSRVTTESHYLATEYVPEVKIANELRAATNRMMYEMRGYGFTEEEEFYKKAVKEIETVKASLSEAEKLSSTAERLEKLGAQVKEAQAAADEYFTLVEQTQKENTELQKGRAEMNENAAMYMKNCNAYLESQNEQMTEEIRSGRTSTSRLDKINKINEIIDFGNEARIGNFKSQALRDPKIFEQALTNFPTIYRLLDEIKADTKRQDNLDQLAIIQKAGEAYESDMKTFLADWLRREEIAKNRTEVGQKLIQACAVTAEAGMSGTEEIAGSAISLLRSSNMVLAIGLVMAVLIGIVLAMFLTRIITTPIQKGVKFAETLAKGDLTATIDVDQKDEIGMLAGALKDMVFQVRSVIDNVKTAANQIAAASEQLTQNAQEQASSTEEASSSMEEMASNIQQNTDNAQQTEGIARKSAQEIKEGYESVNLTVESMKAIADKISIIGEIAEKTDLLAINAAIEAARAGEHGKGFSTLR